MYLINVRFGVICCTLSIKGQKFLFGHMPYSCLSNFINEIHTTVIAKYNVFNKCMFWCDMLYAEC